MYPYIKTTDYLLPRVKGSFQLYDLGQLGRFRRMRTKVMTAAISRAPNKDPMMMPAISPTIASPSIHDHTNKTPGDIRYLKNTLYTEKIRYRVLTLNLLK